MADPSWDEGGADRKTFAARTLVGRGGGRWDGEDEEEDVKESWEDSDDDKPEEKEDVLATETKQTKKKRTLKEILAEKEEKKRKEFEEKKQKELLEKQNLSPEDAFAEKLRRQKLQEDADLQLAKEAFGLKNDVEAGEAGALESMNPSSKEDFDNYRRLLVEIVSKHEKSGFYLSFLEDLLRDLCLNMEADDMKKLSSALNALGNEKVKAAKMAKGGKKKSKKAALVVGRPGDYAYEEFQGGDEYEDFM